MTWWATPTAPPSRTAPASPTPTRCFPQFGHNYNQVSREVLYNWFNKHLRLGQPEPVAEKPFEPVPPKELSVYTDEHPRPQDTADAARLRRYLTEASDRQFEALRP